MVDDSQIQVRPRQAGIYLGLAYLAVDQPLQSVRVLRAAAERYPEDVEIAYQLGQAYLEAMSEGLTQLKKTGSQSALYHWALAIAAQQKDDPVKVIEEYMRALALEPNLAELYWKLTIILRNSGFPELAAAALERYQALNPDHKVSGADVQEMGEEPPVNSAVLTENTGAFLRLWKATPPPRPDPSMPAVADSFVNRALKERMSSPEGADLKAALRLYSQGDYRGATAKISRLKLRATDWAPAYLWASACVQSSDYDAAERVLEDGLLPYLDLPSVSLLAVQIESRLAARYLDRVVGQQPNSYFAKMLLAKYYAAASRDKEALAAYQEALSLAPNQLGIHLAIGQLYENELRWAPAIQEYKAELALDPANGMALAHLGRTLTQAREADEAVPVLQKLLKTNPTDSQAYADLGKDWELKGQRQKAIEAYEHALAYDASQVGLHYRLFELYRKGGDQEHAQKELAAFKTAEAQKHKSYMEGVAALK